MWGCASSCLVGHVCMGVRISFLPHNSATLNFQVLMSMQVDAESKMEQVGTHSVWVRALDGGFGGGWSLWGAHPKK